MGSIPSFSVSDHAPKPDMAGGCVDRLGMTRGRAVTAAVIRRAEMRPALEHLAGNLDIRLTGVIACCLGSAAGVFRNATSFRRVGFVLLGVPVGGPFPGIADHVVNAVSVRREGGDR